jgi:hypothetical protein
MADKALTINPRMATALASKGALFLSRARARGRDAKTRIEAAREARASLEAALREDPLLARERGAALKDSERLLVQQESR